MSILTALSAWVSQHPTLAATLAAGIVLALAGALWALVRRGKLPPVAVLVAALAAVVCTASSGDTSWRFTEHVLGITNVNERAALFAAGELALLACALMARQNLHSPQGTPGTPGVLVWVITGVQVIPSYAEFGMVGGTVRAVLGPVLGALLWHLAMGIELRHSEPGAHSNSVMAILTRELRERLLSLLGLATRGRDAEQISRDRATARAVRLASRPTLHGWGQRRLAAAVARAHVGQDAEQREKLMHLLAARRNAYGLRKVPLPAPWETPTTPQPEPVPGWMERVPEPATVPSSAPEAYLQLPQPVPEEIPDGTRMLPTIDHPEPPAAASEYTPDWPQVQDQPAPEPYLTPSPQSFETFSEAPAETPDEDELTRQARQDFADVLAKGSLPSFRTLKDTYGIGQGRAQQIRDELTKVPA